mgnify:CR=1 FL=1|jgi:hypothetical protein
MKHSEQLLEIVESRIQGVERELQALRRTLSSMRTENNLYSTTSVASESVQEIEIDYRNEEKE